jgi:transcriptional regulator with XRE-family HTH domain
MEPHTVDAGRRQQALLYGEPLGELVRRLMAALDLTQGKLAEVLGLSAPMLSQLMSGQRVKIGNPAVVGRLQALIELSERAPSLDRVSLATALEQIRVSTSPLTGTTSTNDEEKALGALRQTETAASLAAAADAVRAEWPRLAELLDRAARLGEGVGGSTGG